MPRAALIALLIAAAAAAPAGAATEVRDRLRWTGADGAEVMFPAEVRVWCGRWEPDVKARSIHVRAGARPPLWSLDAVLADVRRDPVVRFPNTFVFDEPRGARLFAAYGDNEVGSDTDEASGRIRFERARCKGRPRIALRVRAKLGSEVGGERLSVRGRFSARRPQRD